jgi:hypothetical protein
LHDFEVEIEWGDFRSEWVKLQVIAISIEYCAEVLGGEYNITPT